MRGHHVPAPAAAPGGGARYRRTAPRDGHRRAARRRSGDARSAGRVRYFDDFAVGEQFGSRGVTISEAAILDFALKYDPQRFHLDVEAAKQTPYGGLIASGFQTLVLA